MDYAELRTLIEACGVHPALGPVGTGFNIEQNPHELATFLESAGDLRECDVLELGTGYRAGLARFLTEQLGCKVVTVDRWKPDTPAPLARQILGLSHDPAVVEQVQGNYCLVIIDADHHYEAVKRDFELYHAMGQIVMFHDIAGDRQCEGVAQFWQELKAGWVVGFREPRYEVIAEGEQRAGIGWLKR